MPRKAPNNHANRWVKKEEKKKYSRIQKRRRLLWVTNFELSHWPIFETSYHGAPVVKWKPNFGTLSIRWPLEHARIWWFFNGNPRIFPLCSTTTSQKKKTKEKRRYELFRPGVLSALPIVKPRRWLWLSHYFRLPFSWWPLTVKSPLS